MKDTTSYKHFKGCQMSTAPDLDGSETENKDIVGAQQHRHYHVHEWILRVENTYQWT